MAQIKLSQDVTRWLVEEHGFPAAQPLAASDLVELDAKTTVSFWVYYPQPCSSQELTSAHMGRVLADLHAISYLTRDLPRWVPLESLQHALHDDTAALALDDADRAWLLRRIGDVREELAAVEWSLGHGLIHGDAWAGNLLWLIVLARSNLIPTWHAARRCGKGPTGPATSCTITPTTSNGWPGIDGPLTLTWPWISESPLALTFHG